MGYSLITTQHLHFNPVELRQLLMLPFSTGVLRLSNIHIYIKNSSTDLNLLDLLISQSKPLSTSNPDLSVLEWPHLFNEACASTVHLAGSMFVQLHTERLDWLP